MFKFGNKKAHVHQYGPWQDGIRPSDMKEVVIRKCKCGDVITLCDEGDCVFDDWREAWIGFGRYSRPNGYFRTCSKCGVQQAESTVPNKRGVVLAAQPD